MRTNSHRSGFSLLEMAIVIGIIGLIAGSIVAGQYMIRRSEIGTIISDFGKYYAAFNQFNNQYGGFAGDLIDATDYWTAEAGCPAGSQNPHKETCSGDGDGSIDNGAEMWRAWQHLSNAGYITGTFSGVTGPADATWDAVIGTNVPPGKISRTGFTIRYLGTNPGGEHYNGTYNHTLIFGRDGPLSYTYLPVLTPREAYGIDLKLDDGRPGQGKLYTYTSTYNSGCTDLDTTAAVYSLTNKATACSLLYSISN